MEAKTCVICLEGTVVSVTCPSCNVAVHAKCVESHLLYTVLDPHCPSCSKVWSYDFLVSNLKKSWLLGPYKKHREDVLFDREKALLPDTQEAASLVILERRIRELEADIISKKKPLGMQIREAEFRLRSLYRTCERTDPGITMETTRIQNLQRELASLDERHVLLLQGQIDVNTGLVVVQSTQLQHRPISIDEMKRQFVHPCPAPECRGFLSTGWKCKLCSAKVCSNCGDLINEQAHRCNPDTLASFTLIRRESKPCPKCGVPITKLSGCDHMFCTDCKTAFSWRTMEIHVKGNTNPLYWQWRTTVTHGEEVPIDGCDPDFRRNRILANFQDVCEAWNRDDLLSHPIRHMQQIDLREYLATCNRDEHRDLRIRYLLKEINEDHWRISIQRVEKKQRKARFIANILELFVNGSLDILESLLTTPEQLYECLKQVEELRKVCNAELSKIPLIFDSTEYRITDKYTFKRHDPRVIQA